MIWILCTTTQFCQMGGGLPILLQNNLQSSYFLHLHVHVSDSLFTETKHTLKKSDLKKSTQWLECRGREQTDARDLSKGLE